MCPDAVAAQLSGMFSSDGFVMSPMVFDRASGNFYTNIVSMRWI